MGAVASIPEYVVDRRRRWLNGSVDRRYGTDTGGIIELPTLTVIGDHGKHGCRYQGIQVPVFRDIMRTLRIRHAEFAFVDFGSGKGRAVLMAARYPFQRIVGVEFAPALHEIAVRNLALLRRRLRQAPPIELHCQDAVTYSIPETNLVCFMYNPFDGVVMQKVLDNLAASYAERPRRLIVAYRNPRHREVLDRAEFLGLTHATQSYLIYDTAAAPDRRRSDAFSLAASSHEWP